jgi:GABA permease
VLHTPDVHEEDRMSTALLLPDAPVDRLLAVANETLAGPDLLRAIDELVAPGGEVRVICPALVSRARFWTSDLGAGLVDASGRLARSLDALHHRGLLATGGVGDADPLLAIEDALQQFAAEHLLISTHPPHRSTWLERSVVERAQLRFGLPVTHVVVNLEAVLAAALAS